MNVDFVHNAIIITLALMASAFFSGMEIAFLSSNKLKLELDKKQSSLFGSIAELFGRHSGEYMTTILIGNNIALVIYSLVMSSTISALISPYVHGSTMLIEAIISTLLILFFAEFIPKSIVKTDPNFYYRNFSLPVFIFYLIFFPISKLTTWLSKGVMWALGIKMTKHGVKKVFNKGDLVNLVEDTVDSQTQTENDKEMRIFQNALDFSDLRVRECMVRRVEIEGVDVASSVVEAQVVFVETKFSRLPVYEESIDNIIGYVNIKDLFRNPSSIKEMLIDVLYVPETMAAQKLLATFIKSKNSLAVVLDEFGGTAGMITIEDILEEIFGEIEDEHDSSSLIERALNDGTYVFSGRVEVEHMNEKYKFDIPEHEDYQTLAGYIIFHNESLPKYGDRIDIGEYVYHILKMSSNKIELVKVISKK